MDHLSLGIVFVDSQSRIRYWNRRAEEIFQVAGDLFLEHPGVQQCISLLEVERSRLESRSSRSPQSSISFQTTIAIEAKSVAESLIIDRTIDLIEIDDEQWQMVQLAKKQDPRIDSPNQDLLKLARTDELSGLLNRRGFQSTLEKFLHCRLALAIIDIDFFKRINDTLGHEKGDEAIQWIAERLRTAFPDSVSIGRLGGDEFGVVLNLELNDSAESVRRRFEQFCEQVSNDSIPWYSDGIAISCGVAIGNATGIAARSLLTAADKAMYQSKSDGRNRSTTVEIG